MNNSPSHISLSDSDMAVGEARIMASNPFNHPPPLDPPGPPLNPPGGPEIPIEGPAISPGAAFPTPAWIDALAYLQAENAALISAISSLQERVQRLEARTWWSMLKEMVQNWF